jgi:hypothetical protein
LLKEDQNILKHFKTSLCSFWGKSDKEDQNQEEKQEEIQELTIETHNETLKIDSKFELTLNFSSNKEESMALLSELCKHNLPTFKTLKLEDFEDLTSDQEEQVKQLMEDSISNLNNLIFTYTHKNDSFSDCEPFLFCILPKVNNKILINAAKIDGDILSTIFENATNANELVLYNFWGV